MNGELDIISEVVKAGWYVYPAGGNCEALRFDYPDGLSAWVTDANGPMVPQSRDSPCVVGFYRGDEEEALVEFRCDTVREAVELGGKRIV